MRRLRLAVTGLVVSASVHASGPGVLGIVATCNSCHGIGGVSAGPTMPSLAGQNENYLKHVMLEQKYDKRYSSIMGRLLRTYSDDEIALMASYYAAQPWQSAEIKVETGLQNRGRQIVQNTCQRCHGLSGERVAEGTPRLAGQWPGYLMIESLKYIDPTFHHNKPSERMAERVTHLTADDVAAAAHYFGTRK